MQSVILKISNLIENFIDFINKECCQIIGAKYYSFNMNSVHTMSPTDIVGCPTKVVWLTTLFSKKKAIFIWLLCWPLAG